MRTVIAIAMLWCGVAHADWTDHGGVQLQLELATLHDVEHDAMAPPQAENFLVGGARLNGFFGGKRFGYHVGVDVGTGVTMGATGIAYELSVFPVGVAVRFEETSFVTLGAGVGANGAFGTLDGAATLPVEARFGVGRRIRVLGRARATYVADADVRQSGTMSTHLADELDAMLAVQLGSAYDDQAYPTDSGYFVGATYREALGARFVGVAVGYSIGSVTPSYNDEDEDEDDEDDEDDDGGCED